MKSLIISSFGLGTLLLGVVQTPAMSINIDSFDEGDQLITKPLA